MSASQISNFIQREMLTEVRSYLPLNGKRIHILRNVNSVNGISAVFGCNRKVRGLERRKHANLFVRGSRALSRGTHLRRFSL
jgi:hypothetical protein